MSEGPQVADARPAPDPTDETRPDRDWHTLAACPGGGCQAGHVNDVGEPVDDWSAAALGLTRTSSGHLVCRHNRYWHACREVGCIYARPIPAPHPQGGTEALRALSEAATPGEWSAYFGIHGDPRIVTNPERAAFTTVAMADTGAEDYGRANALWIAAASNQVRALLAAAPAPTEAGDPA